ncbi:molybdopterin molybdotransferase MoeA [Haloarcula halophila]|uniref:molybdopterin molybdotransferase MoeA n=1 Tax=Haloarcula TaxID=2237 RepID=UPI0023E3CA3B|nr:molybdopterin molybdotransferase MoeA [Halomicroarcula sp. DFY41]
MGDETRELIHRTDAVDRVVAVRDRTFTTRPTETVALDRIGGRVLATALTATTDLPPFDYATMDGYAFDATDAYPLDIVEADVYPEDDPPALDDGSAIEIATGAPLPAEANAVLKYEAATVDGDRLRGPPLEPGTATYRRGSNVEAGTRVFERGERLGPKDAVFLRDLGHETVEVFEPLSVGVLATGSEIHEGTQSDLDSPMLQGLVRSWGHEATFEGTVPDEFERVKAAIRRLAEEHDVVLTTGGTSVGPKDYVVRALDDLGTVQFHGVRLRPGKPLALASLPDAVAFAIPGKPIGAHTVASLVVRPFFTGRQDLPTVRRPIAREIELGPDGFEYAIPVVLSDGEAMPLGHVDSPLKVYEREFDPSVLSSSTRATRADGFVLTDSALAAGQDVAVVPYAAIQ